MRRRSLGRYPCGVALVWSLTGLEATSAFARLSRRLTVPACLGNMLVIVLGMWIAHGLKWRVLGPGEDGIEYSVLLVTARSRASCYRSRA